ncbi:MAG: twin-arginine translocase TatA/TatE family subunit [Deltaproteobacteria bacterium]|nr:MAG: twin-arginine translocase TatA/TatE family subunit [Deltaproteobacteria bacterium]
MGRRMIARWDGNEQEWGKGYEMEILSIEWPRLNEWILMGVIVLIVYGISRFPGISGDLGKAIHEFKRKNRREGKRER